MLHIKNFVDDNKKTYVQPCIALYSIFMLTLSIISDRHTDRRDCNYRVASLNR